jgi:heme exporter protein A
MENKWAIETENLKRSFGHIDALNGINLKVPYGDFLTIFGPNGAGKTTLIKILSNLIYPSSGKAIIHGDDLSKSGDAIRSKIGLISHNTFSYNNLTPYENLKFYGKLHGLPNLENRIEELLKEVDLFQRSQDPVRTFSRGMQQRLAIARAMLNNPSIIFLDEPYTGLDQHATKILTGILKKLHTTQNTIIMTTHNLKQGLEVSDEVIIMASGKIVFQKPALEIILDEFEQIYFDCVEKQK